MGKKARADKWKKIEDYGKHLWTAEELLVESAKCAGIAILFAWFFYRSFWAVLPMAAVGIALWKKDCQKKAREDKRKLILQFCDCIHNVNLSMRAGYSLENAFLAAIPDMKLMHGEDSFICLELERIRKGIVMNITVEELLKDLGNRSKAVLIQEFAEALSIAKRSGGSIPEIIRTSAEVIQTRVEAEEEIHTQTTAKRLEQGIMNMMPFGLAIYLEYSNPGYFAPLFHNVQGVCIMSGCLAVYLLAYFLSGKILGQINDVWE